jgi:hypothetical protein
MYVTQKTMSSARQVIMTAVKCSCLSPAKSALLK